ncbi:MAG TPA: NfeD family protein [Nocardioidaceae bacterium]|nr:NfeD family protein [Nocardioidaceae bacterium]
MDWIRDHAWQTWLIAALLLAAAEMATLDFTLLMMAAGAGVGCILAALGFNVVIQVLGAVVTSVALLAFVRPPIVRRLHRAPTLHSGTAGLVGTSGLVLERVTAYSGRVKLSGEVWSARTVDESQVIEPGSKIAVADIDGATAVVKPIP